MSIHQKLASIKKNASNFEKAFREILVKYPTDIRKDLLQQLIEQMCRCVELQASLILLEENGRFVLAENDYHKLLDDYLILFSDVKTLPRARKGSVYEIAIISDIDTVLKCHCSGENIE